MAKKKYWNVIKLLLKLGFTCLLGYLVFQKIDFGQVKSVFLRSHPGYIIAAFTCYLCSQLVSSWRLLGFLHTIGLPVKFWFNVRLYLLGMFYNVFLPGGIGGDGYKIYLLRKKIRLPTKSIFTALLLDRVSGLWAISFLAVVLTLLLPSFPTKEWWPVAIIVGTVVYWLIYKFFFPSYLAGFFINNGKAVLVQSLQVCTAFLILLSQDFNGDVWVYLFCFLMSSLATAIPVSIGGLGIREYAIVNAAAFFNMDQTLAVFMTLAFYIISTLSALPGAWFVYNSSEFEHIPNEEEAKSVEDDVAKPVHLH